ncbi:hypothetical protein B0H17DRAFT_1213369 [Mycena rosella]|uniref:Uncharacterized protein n=1 Tax=Mycena rosella TaxID=1033263 RepID=A0AAD7G570_MYCRO|nr:hypothetical protein B0H17DRAFT_1213369 [Mycena rosella]
MSSLSSVVSNLVRASIGTSAAQVTDADLDKHVAELILKEAKKKAERFGQDGIRAYLRSGTSDSNAPRTNKRFLSSIIRSTDDHNKTILQAQAQAAQELKRERDEAERRERRARAEEAVEAEKLRRSRGESSSRRRAKVTEEGWDRWDGRTAERPKRKQRDWDTWDPDDDEDDDDGREHARERESESGRHGNRPPNPEMLSPADDDATKKARLGPTESRDRGHPHTRMMNEAQRIVATVPAAGIAAASTLPPETFSLPFRFPFSFPPQQTYLSTAAESADVAAREVELRQKLKSTRTKNAVRSTETSGKAKRARSRSRDRTKTPEPSPKRTKPEPSSSRPVKTRAPSRSPTPGPEPEIQLPSKMDKYFEASYDPRLDVAPLTAPHVPATGLINNAEFAGWDAMLQLIQIRKDDREEKKMMERLGLVKDKTTKAYKPISSAAVSERWGGEGSNIMEIEYNKRGSVREWDMGKEGF